MRTRTAGRAAETLRITVMATADMATTLRSCRNTGERRRTGPRAALRVHAVDTRRLEKLGHELRTAARDIPPPVRHATQNHMATVP
jgi:hypothetical protein